MTTSTDPSRGARFPEQEDSRGTADPAGGEERLAELAERIRTGDAGSGDVATYLAQNWQKFVGAFAVFVLALVLFQEYRRATDGKIERASEQFAEAQRAFATTLQGSIGEAKEVDAEKLKRGFEETLRAVQRSHGGSVYADISALYLSRNQLQQGSPELALEALKPFEFAELFSSSAKPVKSKMDGALVMKELAALTALRARNEVAGVDEAALKSDLKALIRNSRLVTVEALTFLFRLSTGVEERAEVEKLTSEILTSRPDLADLIREEAGKFGLSL